MVGGQHPSNDLVGVVDDVQLGEVGLVDESRVASPCCIHSNRPDQWPLSTSTTGKCAIFPVWISVRASKSSSRVPNPPGCTTNAEA